MVRRRLGRLSSLSGNLSLTAKGVLVVAIPVVALLATMAAFYQLQQQSKTAQGWVEHTFQVRAEIRQLEVDLGSAETGIRGYLLTRRGAFLEPYVSATEQIPRCLVELGKLTPDNAGQQTAIAAIAAQVRRNLASMEEMRRDASSGQVADGIAQLENSRTMMAQLHRQLSNMQDREDLLLQQRTETAQRAQTLLENSILAGGVLGLIGGIFAARMRASRTGSLAIVAFFAGAPATMPSGVAVRWTDCCPIIPSMW